MKNRIIWFVCFFIIFGIITILYSRFIATTGLKIKEYKVVNNSITADFHGLKIIHLSDIHYGRTIKKNELKKVSFKLTFLYA